MKKLLCIGLALTALAAANVGSAVAAGTADSAYISPHESSTATTLLATTTANKMKSTPHSSVCTCCNCAMATIEDSAKVKSATAMAYTPAPPDAKPGVIIYDSTALAYGMRDGKVGLVASLGEAQGATAILISTATTADANSPRPGGVALGKLGDGETTAGGKLDATSGNSNAPQLLAGTTSLTCAPPGITFKV